MADKKGAAATKAVSKPPAGGDPAKKGKKLRKKIKDPLARAWRVLRLPFVLRKVKVKKLKLKEKGKEKRAAKKAAWAARYPKIVKRIEWGRKKAKVAVAARKKVLEEIKDARPKKVQKAVKRPAPKESKEKVEGPEKKKEKVKKVVDPKKKVDPAKKVEGPPKKKQRKRKRLHKYKYSGVMKFAKPFHLSKKGKWKVAAAAAAEKRKSKPKKPYMIKKVIGGDKNGGFRMVLRKKRRQDYPTTDPIRKRRARGLFKNHKRYVRKSLKPGTVCIVVAGPHRGKRVVLLKTLESGLLLVNGPKSYNGCPLRRMNQNTLIATRTRFTFPLPVPKHLDDKYFRRAREPKKPKKAEGDIFTTKKKVHVPSEQRKADQKAMDKLVKLALGDYCKKDKSGTSWMKLYLKTMWGLRRNQSPHSIQF